MKILFSGFTIDSEECIYGDYIFLRNCGPNGYLSKYHSPANLDNNEDLHLGKIKIIDTHYQKIDPNIYFEGGPLVGIKSLLYNLSLKEDIEIEIKNELIIDSNIDFYYLHTWLDDFEPIITKNKDIFNKKLIISPHISNIDKAKLKDIKFYSWSHSHCYPADYYLPYPIHKTLTSKYQLDTIKSRENRPYILLYSKKNSKNKHLFPHLLHNIDRIKYFFNKHHITCKSISYTQNGFTRSQLLKEANQCRLCLFLSFYDSGGITVSEISMMGCFVVGFQNIHTNQKVNHSMAPSFIVNHKTGCFLNDLVKLSFKNLPEKYLIQNICLKILHLYLHGQLVPLDIAQTARKHFSEDRFLETVFSKNKEN